MKTERLISIIMLLLERKRMNATELATIFEVSSRTIYRDVEAINRAGIPIVSYMGPNGGVGIMDEYKVDKRVFTTSDIVALLAGLNGVRTALASEEMNSTLAKIKAMIPKEQLAELDAQSNQLFIDLAPWSGDATQEGYLASLRAAIANRRVVTIAYINADNSATARDVEPYRLLLKGGRWYVQGFCLLRNEMRTFRLSRIARMEETGHMFEPRAGGPDDFDVRLPVEASTIDVEIRFPERCEPGIAGLWKDDITIASLDDGYYTARVRLVDDEARYSVLLLVDNCECIGPPKVRDYLKKRIEELLALYH